ncbi:uncharacterized protein [Anabrus simplex]|uniref:uncharacterized protein isoform X2 n=1 Tax=Anabrus simplex TaxID=316456 RepID=UPI0035A2FEEE
MAEDSVEFQSAFISILKEHPILFSKSQLPDIKHKKSSAINAVQCELLAKCNLKFSVQQLYKKLQNMKTRLKFKVDLMHTGNKPICLKEWEKQLMNLMQWEDDSTIGRLKGARSAGVVITSSFNRGGDDHLNGGAVSNPSSHEVAAGPSTSSSAANRDTLDETEQTKHLSNSELQRLVLLKKLKVLEQKHKVLVLQEKQLKEREKEIWKEKGNGKQERRGNGKNN